MMPLDQGRIDGNQAESDVDISDTSEVDRLITDITNLEEGDEDEG